MKKKKQRKVLARALRAEGFKGGEAFSLARAIIKVGSPWEVSAETYATFGVTVYPGSFCEIRYKHTPTMIEGEGGESVVAAFHAFAGIA